MHPYMCCFFDDSIDIGRNSGTIDTKIATTETDVNLDNQDGSATDVKAFGTALSFVFENPKLDLESGSASGNDTGGNVMGVHDNAHDEVSFFGFTNCGSDD